MDMWILIVGGIVIGIGLLIQFIAKKTGHKIDTTPPEKIEKDSGFYTPSSPSAMWRRGLD